MLRSSAASNKRKNDGDGELSASKARSPGTRDAEEDRRMPWLRVEQPDSSSVRVKVESGGETVGDLKVKVSRENGIAAALQQWFVLSAGGREEAGTAACAGSGAGAAVEVGAQSVGSGAGEEEGKKNEEGAPLRDLATVAQCGLAQVSDQI